MGGGDLSNHSADAPASALARQGSLACGGPSRLPAPASSRSAAPCPSPPPFLHFPVHSPAAHTQCKLSARRPQEHKINEFSHFFELFS